MKYLHPFILLFFMIGSGLLIYAPIHIARHEKEYANLEHARGQVYAFIGPYGDTVTYYNNTVGHEKTYTPLVRFISNEHDTVQFRNWMSSGVWEFRCFDSVDVYYLKSVPTSAKIRSSGVNFFYDNFPWMIGGVLFLASLNMFRERVIWVRQKEKEDPDYFKRLN